MSAVALDLSTSGKGKTKKLSGNGLKKLEFKSLDPEIATVDAKGKITAVKAGTTHILVSTKGSDKAFSSTVVSVYDIEPDAKISVPPGGFAPIAISVNGIRESNGYSVPIFFKSAKTSIATVNANGFVHGLKAGKTKLTASVCGNKYTVEVEVSPDAASTHIHSYKEFTDSVKYCEQCGSWYIPAAYRISFNTNGGNILESIVIPEGETVYSSGIELPVPVKEGYEFLGWYIDKKLEKLFESRQTLTGSITLYAGWENIPENTEGDILDPGFMNDDVIFECFTTDIKDVLADGSKTKVTFYATVLSQEYIDTDSCPIKVYEGDKEIASLKDDGVGPDENANDGIFSGRAELFSTDKGAKYYTAKYKDKESETTEVFFYTEIPDEELEGTRKLLGELNKIIDSEDVTAVLKNSNIIDQSSIESNDNHTCITFKTISGILCVWEASLPEEPIDQQAIADEKGTIITSSGHLSFFDVREKLKSLTVTPMHPFKKDICVIRPYRNREAKFDNENYLNTGEILSEALKSNCNVFDDHKATIDLYRHFNDYGVVMIDTHGGTKSFNKHEPHVLTGENYYDHMSEYSPADFEDERVGICSDGDVFVTAEFFDTYYKAHDLDDTVVFLGSCYSAFEGKLTGTLCDKGAVVYGFSNASSHLYAGDTLFELMLDEFLLKRNDAGTAYENVIKTCGKSDPYWSIVVRDVPSKFEMAGDSEYRLIRPVNGSYISGRVFNSDGVSIANAKVSFTANGASRYKELRVNPDGSFLAFLPAGKYSMAISAYGYINETRKLIVIEDDKGVNLDQTILLRPVSEKSTISGIISSSMDGSGVSYAKIRFREYHDNENGEYIKYTSGKDVTVFTDKNGIYSLSGLPQGYYTMEISRNGYYTAYKNIIASADTPLQNLSLTPVIYYGNEDLRIVLEWGQYPLDMDAHLVGPRPDDGQFHVWFIDKTAYANGEVIAYLDLDDKESYGPETIRVNNVTAGDYIFYVNNYMYDGRMAVSNAKVYVFDRSGLVRYFNVPMDQGSERYWNVFRYNYDPESGRSIITPINTITDEPCIDLSDCHN
ncbi:MAG: carboxypeptidase regulatory-like domain-containing protein [Lachnospiraceae bacterium]|nr:carboxypeptidase regulatory-like domain-containing protein [Lachnospiraceae bacterium]